MDEIQQKIREEWAEVYCSVSEEDRQMFTIARELMDEATRFIPMSIDGDLTHHVREAYAILLNLTLTYDEFRE